MNLERSGGFPCLGPLQDCASKDLVTSFGAKSVTMMNTTKSRPMLFPSAVRMAQAKSVYQLLDQLVRACRPCISDGELENRKRSAFHHVADTRTARTNQFEVTSRYEGLAEKLRILNRDEVADQIEGLLGDLSDYDW